MAWLLIAYGDWDYPQHALSPFETVSCYHSVSLSKWKTPNLPETLCL